MGATKDNPIIFYDILSENGHWSPYTHRTRLTLNHKRLPYRVQFLSYPDIEPTLSALGVPPVSETFPRHTLPVIADPPEDPSGKPTFVVDSFHIAVYLDEKYPAPQYPLALPPGTRALHKLASDQFNNEVASAMVPVALPQIGAPGFLDERGREHFCRTREARFGKLTDLLDTSPKKWAEVQEKWDKFGNCFDLNNGEGPFIMGEQVSFTDFTVVGVIHWLRRVDDKDMSGWRRVAEWQGGRWARLWVEGERLERNSTQVT